MLFIVFLHFNYSRKIYEGEDYPMLMAMYLCIMSRVLLSSHEVFTRVINNLAQSHNESDQVTLGKILDIWLKKMRNVSQLDHRKLLGKLVSKNLYIVESQNILKELFIFLKRIP